MYKTTVDIEGMAYGMCEAHINDAVRRDFKVKKVTSSHKNKQTVIISEALLEQSALAAAIEKQGYTVLGINAEPYEKKRFGLFRR